MFFKFRLIISYLYSQTIFKVLLGSIGRRSFIQLPIGLIRNASCVYIGSNSRILFSSRIDLLKNWGNKTFTPKLEIGDNVNIGQNCFISCVDSIIIGDGTLISDNVAIVDNSHNHNNSMSSSDTELDCAPILIGKNVTIYRNSTILAGSVLSNDVVVAANSVVKGTFPDNVLIGGAPAKVLKKLV